MLLPYWSRRIRQCVRINPFALGVLAALSLCIIAAADATVSVSGPSEVGEGESAVLTLTLSESVSSTATFDYSTVAETALEELDYEPVSGTVSFVPGDPLSQQLAISIMSDGIYDPN